jgi:acetyltransferase-like isoleucine patch superfamily enzyme
MKRVAKGMVLCIFLAVVWPAALLSGFGRFGTVYRLFATALALAPGLPGDYLRIAFYRLTLAKCSLSSRIEFGSFFSRPQAEVGSKVYIGSYCILGMAVIGDNTQIASGVQILSGRRQHSRDDSGGVSGSDRGVFTEVAIGHDCWIGAGAIVMAGVGAGSTIGAGAVVTHPIPPGSVAVGNPARVVKSIVAEPKTSSQTDAGDR